MERVREPSAYTITLQSTSNQTCSLLQILRILNIFVHFSGHDLNTGQIWPLLRPQKWILSLPGIMISFSRSKFCLKSSHRFSYGSDPLSFERVDSVRTSALAHSIDLKNPEKQKMFTLSFQRSRKSWKFELLIGIKSPPPAQHLCGIYCKLIGLYKIT